MDSPTLSLSRSSSFAPGPHRRSHPNLHHLSLAPLTPKYPIDPADYSAYFNPSTSELHTSASISQIASLPSPGGILTTTTTTTGTYPTGLHGGRSQSAAHSRASSRTRLLKKKAKSSVSVHAAASSEATTATYGPYDGGIVHGNSHLHPLHPHFGSVSPSGALSSEGFGHRQSQHYSGLHLQTPTSMSDPSWLIQTGLALTEGSRESKGQSWIFKRDSSTSLLQTPMDERLPLRSGRATPSVSRRSSQKRSSRRSFAMTSALTSPMDEPAPDWADDHTQAEIAAQVEGDFTDELDEDPYGLLDFDGQFDSEDEEDVRKEISKYRLGRWMDGIVDVFLQLEDFPEPEPHPSDVEAGHIHPVSVPPVPLRDEETASVASETSVEAPPEKPNGVWDDVAWFGRLIARTVRS